jgi:hypothetical protein
MWFNGSVKTLTDFWCLIVPPVKAQKGSGTKFKDSLSYGPEKSSLPRRFWCRTLPMTRLIFVLFLFAGQLFFVRAEPFDQAEVTKTINLVSLLPQDMRAAPGDLVKGDTALRTGGNSRAELQFPDLTITRVGSNALFRFIAGTREMVLDSGTMLFSSPKGAGGGKVQTGAITAAVTGSDFMISNVGRVKVICLSHKVTVYLTANPKIRAELRPGQMLDIAAADRKMPRATTINLGKLLATSKLGEAGGFRPLPSQAILAQNTNRQRKAFSLAKDNLTSESAQEVRSTTEFPDSPTEFANNSSSQSRQTVAAQNARESEDTTSAASTVENRIAEDPAKNTNNGNRNGENRGNSSKKENPGNSGKKENPSNSAKKEVPGNSGNNGNPGDSVKKENPGNSVKNENSGNSVKKENPGNSGNNGNRGNSGNNGNRGNSGNNGNRGNSGKQ